ncbi:Type I restriction modification DNA specificity domain-containing protein [Eubacterium maltosivorans]|uniref:Type I restriction modification DNA specificity domain-containing protein n=1 Tax=Eubacterium maltosivorans TaxID=2041044 RepID=A0A4P9CAX1_EUBML|nr:restriction endonuclease subunit S [Eubacterium maltosivorans]QCT72734.1 hypothetical protein CPZ25_015835 [Eubacterium maltosivorans]WPK81663.1 hypothetical protein EUMA32_31190 [Eubacterium maltosivorans]SDP79162.1 Type I restriction modification DNA specificity domain-containing protein [Eubacterium maltosivorans]
MKLNNVENISNKIFFDMNKLIFSLQKLIIQKIRFKKIVTEKILTGNMQLPGFEKIYTYKKIGDLCKIQRIKSSKILFNKKKNNQDKLTNDYIKIRESKGQVVLSANEETFNSWFYFLVKFLESELIKKNNNFGSAAIQIEDLLELIVPVPPYLEQKSIAHILNDLNTEIQQLEKKLDKYKQIKREMEFNLFV